MNALSAWSPGPLAAPRIPNRPQDVPEARRDVAHWMATGAAGTQLAACFTLDPTSPNLAVLRNEAPHVEHALNFWVTADMVDLLDAAAPSFPLDSTVDFTIGDHGFLILQRPLKLWGNATDLLVGMYWRAGNALPMLAQPPHVNRVITFTPPIDLDSDPQIRAAWSTAEQAAWRVLATTVTMLGQRIALPRVAPRDRATTRRLNRLNVPLDPVQLIELRRPAAHETTGDGTGPVNWQRRWIVGGHWRRAWIPSANRHEPRWIAPHIKGPSHLPLHVSERVHVWRR